MLIKDSLKVVTQTEVIFCGGIVEGNKQTLLDIFNDDGLFAIQDENFDTLEVDKLSFIDWLLDRQKDVESFVYYFDRCTFCRIGNPAVIFNNGYFPKRPKDSLEKEKAALVFVFNQDSPIETACKVLETQSVDVLIIDAWSLGICNFTTLTKPNV